LLSHVQTFINLMYSLSVLKMHILYKTKGRSIQMTFMLCKVVYVLQWIH